MKNSKTTSLQRQYLVLVAKEMLPEFIQENLNKKSFGYQLPVVYTVSDIPMENFYCLLDTGGETDFGSFYDGVKIVGHIMAFDGGDLKEDLAHDISKLKSQNSANLNEQEIKMHYSALSLAGRITEKKKTSDCPKKFKEDLESYFDSRKRDYDASHIPPMIIRGSRLWEEDYEENELPTPIVENSMPEIIMPLEIDLKKVVDEIFSDRRTQCYAFRTNVNKPVTL